MNPLTLTLRQAPRQRIDMSPLSPDMLVNMHHTDIVTMRLRCGNRSYSVNSLFEISGGNAGELLIRQSSDKLDRIGANMRSGHIRIEGNVGDYLGLGMQGGRIEVRGHAGHWTAAGLHDGLVLVEGNCGDFAGAALPGEREGMRGGTLLIRGNVGDRAGDHLRRVVILIEGNASDYCGARMVAGTIVILGRIGARPGYAMKRGTLLLNNPPSEWHPTLCDCGQHNLGFLHLLLKSIADVDSRFSELMLKGGGRHRVHRFAGDLANDGKGEVLIMV